MNSNPGPIQRLLRNRYFLRGFLFFDLIMLGIQVWILTHGWSWRVFINAVVFLLAAGGMLWSIRMHRQINNLHAAQKNSNQA